MTDQIDFVCVRPDHQVTTLVEALTALFAGAMGNVFVANHMHRNQHLDALDKNAAGVNTWLRSQCATSDPAPFCTGATTDETSD